MKLIYVGLPPFSELLLIGSFLGILFFIVAYVHTNKDEKEIRNKIKIYFLLCLIGYIILLFVTQS